MATGITVISRKHKEVIQIAFSFRGAQCREIVDLPPTKSNLAFADRLRSEIKSRIERSLFRYDDYFPDSPRCKIFGHSSGKTTLIKALLTDYKNRSKASLQPSTWSGYRKAIDNVLIPEFGDIQVGR